MLELDPSGARAGFEPEGWDDRTWILHAMYEIPELPAGYTHDDSYRAELAAGEREPSIVGDANLDEIGIVRGGALGFRPKPKPPWQRLRWTELTERIDDIGDRTVPPSFRWFPYASWPASIEPPCEGSLDEVSLALLVRYLEVASPPGDCLAYYTAAGAGLRDEWHVVVRGPVRRLDELVAEVGFTPNNVWAVDRSWFVYTDADLWGTRVSGRADLIAALREATHLETIDWQRT